MELNVISSIITTAAIGTIAGIAIWGVKKMGKKSSREAMHFKEEIDWYKKALEFHGIGIYRWDSQTKKYYWSDKLYDIRGAVDPESYDLEVDEDTVLPTPENFYDFVHEEDREVLKSKVQKCLEKRRQLSYEYRYILPNGELRWHKEKANVIADENGNSVVYGAVVDITDQKIREEQLEHYALRDKLTGLPNRAGFDRYLNEAIKKNNVKTDILALCFIDLNGFKAVNDTHGHEAGDHVLRIVASCLASRAKENEYVARLGGDEFVVLLKSTKEKGVEEIRELRKSLAESFIDVTNEAGDLKVGAAIGVAIFPQEDTRTAKDLLAHADEAMYAAKRTKEWFKIFFYKTKKDEEEQED